MFRPIAVVVAWVSLLSPGYAGETGENQGAPRPERPSTRPALAKEDPRLTRAIEKGDAEAVAKLLDGGASVNTQGDSPLCLAANLGKLEVAKRLLARGADPDSSNHYGCSSLYCAAYHGDAPMVRLLLESGAGVDKEKSLKTAAYHGAAEVVRLLLDHKADANARGLNGETALYAAAAGGRAEVAKLLLDAGADPRIADNNGTTPAGVARRSRHRAVAEMIEGYTPKARPTGGAAPPAKAPTTAPGPKEKEGGPGKGAKA